MKSQGSKNPFQLFSKWYSNAAKELGEEHASTMCLATSTKDGKPSARMVLLKKYNERGFCFFTNLGSRKSKELLNNPYASLCFYWQALGRQIRIEGEVIMVTEKEADAYFNSRHPRSRLGAIASRQSEVLKDYRAFIEQVDIMEAELGDDIPRPKHWSGFRLVPEKIEFWQEGESRLHQRHLYSKDEKGKWQIIMLYP